MKVKNSSIYMGQDERVWHHREEKTEGKQNGKNIFAGNLSVREDTIIAKKKMAQQKALKIVGDTFAAEQKIDEEQNDRREKVKELLQQANDLKGYRESYEAFPEEEMTEEMKKERDQAILEYQKQYDSVMEEVKAELMTIEAVSRERLKSSPMQEAREQAEDIMAAAGEEIVDMLMQEAKENIDEKQEEREEKAEKIAEKKEEEEERLKKAEENKEEAEVMAETIRELGSGDLQKEIDEMLDKLKLLEEDIKGAAVDKKL